MSLHRRGFLASTSAGIALAASAGRSARAAAAASPLIINEAAAPGMTREELPTPALLLDLDAFEANVKTVADQCQRTRRKARPHAKTHKCPEIGRRQVAAGAVGNCAATVPEAEAMAEAGLPSVLLTSPIFDPLKIQRMIAIAGGGTETLLAVGHPKEMQMLAEAAQAAGVVLNVLLDLDVGDKRFGIPPGDPALELARMAASSKHLRLRGIQAYSGMTSHVHGFEARQAHSRAAMGQAVAMRERLEKAGLEAGILSGGSSGTYNIDSEIDGVTELQVGSYVFMDVGYREIGGKNDDHVYTDFLPSLTVLTTVVSASHKDRVTLDAGIKSFATDSDVVAQAKGRSGLIYSIFGDEFGLLTAEPGVDLPEIGERLEFIVPHCDPTVNLYNRMYAMRGDKVEGVWPIVARRELG